MKAAFSFFTICLFSMAASEHTVLQQEHFDCSFDVGGGAIQTSAINRTLSVEQTETVARETYVHPHVPSRGSAMHRFGAATTSL